MIIEKKLTKKKLAHDELIEFLRTSPPSKDRGFLFHNPKITLTSKRVILSEKVRTKLNYKGIKIKYTSHALTPDEMKEHGIKSPKGYEPLMIWVEKRTNNH